MSVYQYNLNILIGITGDVWFNTDNIDITNINASTYGEKRDNYQRISNLPPIKKIVRVTNNSISMITRDNRYIHISSNISIAPSITDAYMVNDSEMIYLTVDRKMMVSKNLLDPTESTSLASDVTSIHPLKLKRSTRSNMGMSQYINYIFVRYLTYDVILGSYRSDGWSNYSRLIRTFIDNDRLIIKVYLDVILTESHILSLSIDVNDKPVVESFNISNAEDVIRYQSQIVILTNKTLSTLSGTPLINGVERLIKFIEYSPTQFYPVGVGDKIYDSRLQLVPIPMVLA